MFIAYEISKQLIVSLRPLVPVIQASDRDLADQLKRAAQSVLLNLAEGQKFEDGNRRKHYAIAHSKVPFHGTVGIGSGSPGGGGWKNRQRTRIEYGGRCEACSRGLSRGTPNARRNHGGCRPSAARHERGRRPRRRRAQSDAARTRTGADAAPRPRSRASPSFDRASQTPFCTECGSLLSRENSTLWRAFSSRISCSSDAFEGRGAQSAARSMWWEVRARSPPRTRTYSRTSSSKRNAKRDRNARPLPRRISFAMVRVR